VRRAGPLVAWPDAARLLLGAALAVAVVIATMFMLDAWSVRQAEAFPAALLTAAGRFTDLGKSGYFLWPLGILMLMLAVVYSPAMPRFWARHPGGLGRTDRIRLRSDWLAEPVRHHRQEHDRTSPAVRRRRPRRLGLRAVHVHPATRAFRPAKPPRLSRHWSPSARFFPQARALLWIYAVLIAPQPGRHHRTSFRATSLGRHRRRGGAVMVRNWFAARRLGFSVAADGSVRAMPGPSFRRIIKAVARRLHSA
jgi:undecaprenyl-diphosphatase